MFFGLMETGMKDFDADFRDREEQPSHDSNKRTALMVASHVLIHAGRGFAIEPTAIVISMIF